MKVIDRLVLKDLYCKNDSCMKLMGWAHVNNGVVAFACPNCHKISVFRMNYSHARELIDELMQVEEKKLERGGEILYG